MSALLETVMLVCFGLSWPLNVWKNLKARTAKNMSLPFILLIILGYLAGIGAKLYTGSISYVLAVCRISENFFHNTTTPFFLYFHGISEFRCFPA